MATPHNEAEKGSIATTVLMPGDPLRAKYIADNYLDNPVMFNRVRNMFGYTGEYKGRKISVMGSGMGMPSIGIYSYELYSQYGVNNIIRIGSAGSYSIEANVYDVVLVTEAYSDVFYREDKTPYYEKLYKEKECVAVEMESFALFHNAAVLGKNAACILTISDSFVTHEETTAQERQKSFTKMMELALETAIAAEEM